MHILILAILLQAQSPRNSINLTRPQNTVVTSGLVARNKTKPPLITSPAPERTMPSLTPESEIHAQMEHEIGGQQQALDDLRSSVGILKLDRENEDRPEIKDLQSFRDHVLWTSSLASTVFFILGALIWKLRRIIWTENLKPRVRIVVFECLNGAVPGQAKDQIT